MVDPVRDQDWKKKDWSNISVEIQDHGPVDYKFN